MWGAEALVGAVPDPLLRGATEAVKELSSVSLITGLTVKTEP